MRCLILVYLLLISAVSNAEQELVFSRNEYLPEQDVAEVVFRQAMKNLNIEVDVRSVPPARARALNLQGAVAGEVARIESYGDKNPSLIRVLPGHYYLTSVVYAAKGRGIVIPDRESLRGYQIAHLRGVQHSADIVRGLPNVRESNNSESLFGLLEAGRVDVVITTGIDGRIALEAMQLNDAVEVVGELAKLDLFVYLNPEHKQLQTPIAQELARMKASGEMDKIIAAEEQRVALQN